MKKIVLMVLASLPALAFAQTGKYKVQGTIGALNAPAKIYLQFRQAGKTLTDSVTLKDGKFQFSGTVGTSPVMGYLELNQKGTGPGYKDYKAVYFEKGTITVTSNDTLASAKLKAQKPTWRMPNMTLFINQLTTPTQHWKQKRKRLVMR